MGRLDVVPAFRRTVLWEWTMVARRRTFLALVFVLAVLAILASLGIVDYAKEHATFSVSVPERPRGSASSGIPNFDHVLIIMMENKEYPEIIGSAQAPFINQLAATYAVATRYYAIRHPSLPNYLALVSGSTLGLTYDCGNCSVNARNLADQLEEREKSWGVYAEDMPGPCFNGRYAGGPIALLGQAGYVRRHNPLMYFTDISQSQERCENVVPLDGFASALQANRLPDFVLIVPNLQHDMHRHMLSTAIKGGDKWLASFVPTLLASPAWSENSVLFILWDEGSSDEGCCGDAAGGRAPALVIAAQGARGYRSAVLYTHYSVLRTIEDAWQLDYLGHAGDPDVVPMADFFP